MVADGSPGAKHPDVEIGTVLFVIRYLGSFRDGYGSVRGPDLLCGIRGFDARRNWVCDSRSLAAGARSNFERA
jgi:hypothetical protein